MPEATVAPATDAAAPDLPEEGMKSLNALMTEMLAEAEKVGVDEKKVEARLLSLLKDMRAYKEALAAKKKGPNSTEQFGMRLDLRSKLRLLHFRCQYLKYWSCD